MAAAGSTRIAIVDREPRDKVERKLLRHTLVEMVHTAQDSITLISPYFVPTRMLRTALKEAAANGTKLNVMISAKSDIPLTPSASLYVAHKLMKRGANVYLFNGGFHHSKTLTVDGTHSTVGSANLNSRSLRYDYEVNAFLFDRPLTLQIDSLFHADTHSSTRLTPEVWRSFSIWKRWGCWLANLLTPFL
jgi:cardiolipin synthase